MITSEMYLYLFKGLILHHAQIQKKSISDIPIHMLSFLNHYHFLIQPLSEAQQAPSPKQQEQTLKILMFY